MSDRSIRVLLAEDSPTVRRHLLRLINESPNLEVVGEARDGYEALEMAEKLKPDVISMDIRMPGMDGLEATRQIMTRCPTPIVMVSGVLDDEISLSFQAIEAGALAVIPKPPARDEPDFPLQQRQLTNMLSAMAGVSLVRRRGSQPDTRVNGLASSVMEMQRTPTERIELVSDPHIELVAIGASAGGPSALSIVLGSLPAHLPVPIVIVQHLPDEFIAGLAHWLDDVTPLTVRVATEGTLLQPGEVYISPGKAHLQVVRRGDKLAAHLLHNQEGYRYCPSVDVLFHSVAETCGAKGAGFILTGMGDDGAEGLLALRRAGGRTFAQDRESCTVFGMPAAAIELGAVDEVLALRRVSSALLHLV